MPPIGCDCSGTAPSVNQLCGDRLGLQPASAAQTRDGLEVGELLKFGVFLVTLIPHCGATRLVHWLPEFSRCHTLTALCIWNYLPLTIGRCSFCNSITQEITMKVQKLDLLISIYILCIALAELMGGKTFPLINIFDYQLNASVAIFVLPIIFTINDVITEVYGKERTRSVIRSGLIAIGILLAFTLLATSLPPSKRFENSESAYDLVFITSARIAASSLTAFALAEFLDVIIFTAIRNKFGKSKLWLRNNLSNFLAQLVDTSVFMTLAFYSFDQSLNSNLVFLPTLILPYWLLKCSISVIETPFVYLGVKWLEIDSRNI